MYRNFQRVKSPKKTKKREKKITKEYDKTNYKI